MQSATLVAAIKFKVFCEVCEKVATVPVKRKSEILRKFIDSCRELGKKLKDKNPEADVSLFPVLRLLLPELERDRGPYGLKETALGQLCVRVFCLGKKSSIANKLMNYKAPASSKSTAKDFADTAYEILRPLLRKDDSVLTLEHINSFLDTIAKSHAANRSKDQEFKTLVNEMNAFELKWLLRIILKDLRLGLGHNKILNAYHPDAQGLFEVTGCLRKVGDKLTDPDVRIRYGIEVFSHFKPMLLEKCKIEDASQLFHGAKLEYFLQTKYDGERSQIHMKDGMFKYFTRNGYEITHNDSYGESRLSGGLLTSRISRLLNPECRSIILDGELMGWHKEKKRFGSKGMSFDVKKLTPNSSHQPCFVAFDIIMYNDKLLVDLALKDRLSILETAFEEEEGIFVRGTTTTITDCEELLTKFNESLQNCEEGIVVKRSDAIYKPNVRTGSGYYKIKAEYSDGLIQDMDLTILGGYYGQGKCRGTIRSFLTGVAHPPSKSGEDPTEFHAFVSVSSGIGVEKLEGILNKLDKHWVKQCPVGVVPPRSRTLLPDIWIRPENSIVLQVRATEMIRSSSYPTGYTLRFPRVAAVRDDKPWHGACTTTELGTFVKDLGVIHKLTKRQATGGDIDKAPAFKFAKAKKSDAAAAKGKLSGARQTDVTRITRLMDGKEFCVINGNESLSKQDIEKILLEHGAKVVQNPGKKTFGVIVGDPNKLKARNAIRSGKYDIVTVNWLTRVVKDENWSSLEDWFPWELLSCRQSTEDRLAAIYDEFHDSYIRDADKKDLERSMTRAGSKVSEANLTLDEYREVDEQLFEDGVSPFSLFRDMVGYFDNPVSLAKYEFRFMGGVVKEDIDESVTHVFVDNSNVGPFVSFKRIAPGQRERVKIVSDTWLNECFRSRKLLPYANCDATMES